jgi:hypothetical protein
MTDNIVITKSGTEYSVTIMTSELVENWDNKISYIRPPQSKQKQDSGPKDTKVIDLLIITHTLVVKGTITPDDSNTSKTIKDNLIALFKGGGISSTPCTVSYDGDNYNMFIEKLMIVEKAGDYTPTSDSDEISTYINTPKYEVSVTLVEGVST